VVDHPKIGNSLLYQERNGDSLYYTIQWFHKSILFNTSILLSNLLSTVFILSISLSLPPLYKILHISKFKINFTVPIMQNVIIHLHFNRFLLKRENWNIMARSLCLRQSPPQGLLPGYHGQIVISFKREINLDQNSQSPRMRHGKYQLLEESAGEKTKSTKRQAELIATCSWERKEERMSHTQVYRYSASHCEDVAYPRRPTIS
jgi:hypothetical protein